MNASLTFGNSISSLLHIPCADALICAAVLFTGVALCVHGYTAAKKIDLIES